MQLCSPRALDFVSALSVCFCVCVSVSGWETLGGTEHKGTSEKAHRRHRSNPPPPSSLIQSPCSLLQRWACTLAVAPVVEARLLFKAALSFGLFFFSLMSTENFMPSLTHTHTPHLQNHKKGKERTERWQNKMGTAVAILFLPPPPHPPVLASGKTHFQSFPPDSPATSRFRLVV